MIQGLIPLENLYDQRYGFTSPFLTKSDGARAGARTNQNLLFLVDRKNRVDFIAYSKEGELTGVVGYAVRIDPVARLYP